MRGHFFTVIRAGTAVLVLCFEGLGAVQQPQPEEVDRFRAAVNEVLVPVTVTNARGLAVMDLAPGEFRLFEDGARRAIDSVLGQETPLTLGIAADVSGSMDGKIEIARGLLCLLFDHLQTNDRAFLGGFGEEFTPIQAPTADRSRLRKAISGLEPFGNTALYDGVAEGLERLKDTGGRRALIVISDGLDNRSRRAAREAIHLAKATGIAIHTLGLGEKPKRRSIFSVLFPRARRAPLRGLDAERLHELAASTGGRLLLLTDSRPGTELGDGVRSASDRLLRELRGMYVLAYRPARDEFDGKWHKLRVEVVRPNLFVRYRPGYLAATPLN